MNLADQDHDVLIVDNLSRRKIDIDLEVESLTPITSIGERLNVWESIGGKPMRFIHMDIAHEYQRLLDLIIEEKPDSIVHFAEQRAAPYSMKSSATAICEVGQPVGSSTPLRRQRDMRSPPKQQCQWGWHRFIPRVPGS